MKPRRHKPDPHMPSKQPDPPRGFKKCTACFETLPHQCFAVNRRMKDGYSARCSQCRNLVARFRRKPENFHLIELPVVIVNEQILESLHDGSKYEYQARGGFNITIDFTRQQKKIHIYHGDTTLIDMDFQQADAPTCLYWIKNYLTDNEIWIVPK